VKNSILTVMRLIWKCNEKLRLQNWATKCRKVRVRTKQGLLQVGGWEDWQWAMMHVGKWCHGIKQSGHQKDKKVHGVIKHIEKQCQKNFVPGKNIVIYESIVGFKCKIIFETYNPKKPNEVVHRVICISWKWHWLRSQYNSKLQKTYKRCV
jgi:hypothetical protein